MLWLAHKRKTLDFIEELGMALGRRTGWIINGIVAVPVLLSDAPAQLEARCRKHGVTWIDRDEIMALVGHVGKPVVLRVHPSGH